MLLTVETAESMNALGVRISTQLRIGDLVLLSGPLGAGKTALTQGIGKGLGITGITSPTFVISRIHAGKIPLVHVDAYRLQGDNSALFDDLDLDSLLVSSIVIIEWGEGLIQRIGSEYLEIDISILEDFQTRSVSIRPHGLRWQGFSV